MSKYDFSKPVKEGRIYKILMPLGRFVRFLRFRVRYVGVENIPESGGFILASNHIHMIDPLMIGLGIKNRQLHFMAKKELWNNPIVAWAFTKVNGFPIDRGGADSQAIRHAVQVIENGYIFAIFPEGTRSRNGKIGKPKRGVANIAAQAKCGVLPVSVYNNQGLKIRSKYTVRFGELIPYEELGLSENATRDEQSACADMIMAKITELQEEGHCE
ncbi:MAG: 1-acyl-sn-glycerol-3-phosphate acyltransferase [Clostridia bacterium]|nr:1-acyl-sn-glycerol-3-phosphate acyltransferase [Clostridia bacterium]